MGIFFGCPRQIENCRIKSKLTESTCGDSGNLPKSKYKTSQIQNEESWALFEPARAEFKNAKIKSQTVVVRTDQRKARTDQRDTIITRMVRTVQAEAQAEAHTAFLHNQELLFGRGSGGGWKLLFSELFQ